MHLYAYMQTLLLAETHANLVAITESAIQQNQLLLTKLYNQKDIKDLTGGTTGDSHVDLF